MRLKSVDPGWFERLLWDVWKEVYPIRAATIIVLFIVALPGAGEGLGRHTWHSVAARTYYYDNPWLPSVSHQMLSPNNGLLEITIRYSSISYFSLIQFVYFYLSGTYVMFLSTWLCSELSSIKAYHWGRQAFIILDKAYFY